MPCNFTLKLSQSPEHLFKKAQVEALKHRITFTGNSSQGSFLINALGGVFEGSYMTTTQTVVVKIDRKPFLIPCSLIENFLIQQV